MKWRCRSCGTIDANVARANYRDAQCPRCNGPLTLDADPMEDLGFECPACHATVPATAMRCPACRAGKTSAAKTRCECPVCTIPLSDRAIEGAVVSACEACGGVFLDHDVLERWIADRGARAPSELVANGSAPIESAVRYRSCPQCGDLMNRTIFAQRSGIIVDVCKRDGVWFDGGELEAAIEFARSGRYDESRLRVQRESGAAGLCTSVEALRDPGPRPHGLVPWAAELARFLFTR